MVSTFRDCSKAKSYVEWLNGFHVIFVLVKSKKPFSHSKHLAIRLMTYFQFFDLPVSFYLDEKLLKKRFLLNSKKYHPDFYTLESEERQAEILDLSTQNNQAYKTLSNFDSRMKYILNTKGTLEEEGKNSIPQIFLMEVMEIQEAIMELEFGFDEKAYNQANQAVSDLEQGLLTNIQPVLESYNEENSTEEELKKVKDFYLKRKYLWRIKENLNRFAPASPKGATM